MADTWIPPTNYEGEFIPDHLHDYMKKGAVRFGVAEETWYAALLPGLMDRHIKERDADPKAYERKNRRRARNVAANPRLRFQVLQRDGFTCQYCGAKPPDVRLHVDHIKPVSMGGVSTMENLITACQECNQGKSALVLEGFNDG